MACCPHVSLLIGEYMPFPSYQRRQEGTVEGPTRRDQGWRRSPCTGCAQAGNGCKATSTDLSRSASDFDCRAGLLSGGGGACYGTLLFCITPLPPRGTTLS